MLSVPSEPYTSILLYCKQNQKGSSIKDDGTKGEGVWRNVDKSGHFSKCGRPQFVSVYRS